MVYKYGMIKKIHTPQGTSQSLFVDRNVPCTIRADGARIVDSKLFWWWWGGGKFILHARNSSRRAVFPSGEGGSDYGVNL